MKSKNTEPRKQVPKSCVFRLEQYTDLDSFKTLLRACQEAVDSCEGKNNVGVEFNIPSEDSYNQDFSLGFYWEEPESDQEYQARIKKLKEEEQNKKQQAKERRARKKEEEYKTYLKLRDKFEK